MASMGVAEPIPLLEHLLQYLTDHDSAVDQVTDLISSAMRSILDKLGTMQQKDYAASLPK